MGNLKDTQAILDHYLRSIRHELYNDHMLKKLLLMMVNVQQAIRFLLPGLNTYKNDLPELTDKFQELYRSCPTLFDRVLPRSDRQQLHNSDTQDSPHAWRTAMRSKVMDRKLQVFIYHLHTAAIPQTHAYSTCWR